MKIDKNIIFVGNPAPGELVESGKVSTVSIADNIAQNTIIRGLHKYYEKRLTVISVSSEKSQTSVSLGDGVEALTISSSRLNRVFYYLSIMINYTKKLNRIFKSIQDKNTIIITSGPYIYVALPAMIARWRYGAKWVPFLVGAIEVPEEKFPYSLISKLSRPIVRKADGVITYVSKSATDYMPGKPFVEIFYIIDFQLMEVYRKFKPEKPKKLTIAYTGTLSDIYNIGVVIEVIKKTGDKYHWVFAGSGKYAEKIKELANNENYDVEYLGIISNIEAIKLQKTCHLLLCLKGGDSRINQYYGKYAASGKLIEYLCSGTPILAGDILAFSNKIKPFISCEINLSVKQIENAIEMISLNYNEKLKLAHDGQKYAFKYFTADYQDKIIYEFLEKL